MTYATARHCCHETSCLAVCKRTPAGGAERTALAGRGEQSKRKDPPTCWTWILCQNPAKRENAAGGSCLACTFARARGTPVRENVSASSQAERLASETVSRCRGGHPRGSQWPSRASVGCEAVPRCRAGSTEASLRMESQSSRAFTPPSSRHLAGAHLWLCLPHRGDTTRLQHRLAAVTLVASGCAGTCLPASGQDKLGEFCIEVGNNENIEEGEQDHRHERHL